ncbi:MAG: hypothetical protein M1325_02795 [Actinobacteria bacterium]|nr:hypothetical protein [Actinomycetota bacterium]
MRVIMVFLGCVRRFRLNGAASRVEGGVRGVNRLAIRAPGGRLEPAGGDERSGERAYRALHVGGGAPVATSARGAPFCYQRRIVAATGVLYAAGMHAPPVIRRPGGAGHTLAELLVALGILAVCATGAVIGLGHVTAQAGARGAAQVFQAAVSQAQAQAAWCGGPVELRLDHRGIALGRPAAPAQVYSFGGPAPQPRANILRWQEAGGVHLHFAAPFGSPDGAGTVSFSAPAGDIAVVVRAESGLTWRTSR